MIQDLDDTLKQLLIQKVPIDEATIDIKFETPDSTKDWDPKPTRPTINLFLYDIRENLELRSNERFFTRTGNTGIYTDAPVRIDMSYLITAWTADIADEHALLSRLLKTLLRYPILPDGEGETVLQGELANSPYPLRAWIAQPERTPNIWDIWGAVDGQLKTSISYTVTVAIATTEPSEPIDVVRADGGAKLTIIDYGPNQTGEPLIAQRSPGTDPDSSD
ncbi:MAG: DUF4255 domain-containing protein [Cyanobacteria bacterium P01_F01_bin.150]